MAKRILSVVLLLCMMIGLGVTAFADVRWFGMEQYINSLSGREIENIKYMTAANDQEALVVASKGGIADYRIRADYYGLPVTEIMEASFSGNYFLQSLTIPNTVRVIGASAVSDCKNLKSVAIPSSVRTIGEYAFAGSGLTAITIPGTVQSVGRFAFNCCHDLQSVRVESGSFAVVGPYLFSECENLRTVNLAPTVTAIHERAFESCSAVETVRAPGVRKIQDMAFFLDKSLRSIVLSADLSYVGTSAFQGCDGLTDVYYGGTEAQWSAIDIRDRNEPLRSARIHFNSALAQFADLTPGAYYLDAVSWALQHAVTNGMGPDSFAPNGNCTRAQVVTFLWRAMNEPEPKSTQTLFTDVPVDSYYARAVAWAAEQGITNGVTADRFGPDATCTRAQVVTFLWRARSMPAPGTDSPFVDVPAGTYYYDAVLWAVPRGVTNGTDDTHFSPDATCTRAQVVTFLYRDLNKQ